MEYKAVISSHWPTGENKGVQTLWGRFDIQMGEHWASKESKVFQLYEIAKANVKNDKTPDIGENEKFGG